MEPLAYSIKGALAKVPVSRSTMYVAIGDGKLRAHKLGRNTIIFAADLEEWLNSLPMISPKRNLSAILNPEKEAAETVTETRAAPAIQPPATERRRAREPVFNE